MNRSFFATKSVSQASSISVTLPSPLTSGDEALAGGTVGALRVALRALETQDLDGLLDVAVGLDERLLGVDHAGAELLAQRLDVGDGEVGHGWRLLDCGEFGWDASAGSLRTTPPTCSVKICLLGVGGFGGGDLGGGLACGVGDGLVVRVGAGLVGSGLGGGLALDGLLVGDELGALGLLFGER